MGFNGIEEILNHPWLRGFTWAKLLNKEIRSLYVPGVILYFIIEH
jgi:serum/glucocorticoid-regulated kinase 2